MKAGFTGGVVVDFPNSTKAKKYANDFFTIFNREIFYTVFESIFFKRIFLCLFSGGTNEQLPRGLSDNQPLNNNRVQFTSQRYHIIAFIQLIKIRVCFYSNLSIIHREKFRGKSIKKSKDWIIDKKERQRRQGKYDIRFLFINLILFFFKF